MGARLLADEDVDAAVCDYLRGYGHSITLVRDMKASPRDAGPDDDDVLFCAAADERAVLTCNIRDYETLHEQGARHWGIVGCPAQGDPRTTAQVVNKAIREALAANNNTLFMQCFRVTLGTRTRRGPRRKKN